MESLFSVDLAKLFTLEKPLLEVFLRGTIIFVFLFAVFRVFRREMGAIGIADVLVIVLLANASESGLTGGGESITESILLVLTIVLWDRLFDNLEHRFPALSIVFRPRKTILIENGALNRRNMRRELITEDELKSQLRQQGVDNFADVKKSYMEGDGNISVIKNNSEDGNQGETQKPAQKFAS